MIQPRVGALSGLTYRRIGRENYLGQPTLQPVSYCQSTPQTLYSNRSSYA